MERFESKFEKRVESDRENRIKEIEKRVDETTDKLGMPIDPEIKETVIAFNIWKFPTSGSCEGHLHKEGASYPWVEVYLLEPEEWEKDEEKKKEWTIENLKYRKKTMDMLEEFYKDREAPVDNRLSFSNIGIYGGFRIQSTGAELMPLLSLEEQKEKLKLYRKEMNEFAKFLRNKFLKK